MDIANETLNAMQRDFELLYRSNRTIDKILEKTLNHTATYKDVDRYAMEVGEIRETAILNHVGSVPIDEYDAIAETILSPQLKRNYDLVCSVAAKTQEALNAKSRLGLKAVQPEYNTDKAYGLIAKLKKVTSEEEAISVIHHNVTTFTKGVVSDALQANVDFHHNVGLSPVIKRIAFGHCCEWCEQMAGVYNYADVKETGNDVYRFHANCRCYIVYDPQDGSRKISTKTRREV